ncbi:MAG: hypothetical protein ABG776_09070 [Cyanobacteria bacterium J06555_13]
MPFGQSWAARQETRVVASALGAPPIVEEVASRAVGWTVAHLTLDHHHQVLAEIADHPTTQTIVSNTAQVVLDQSGVRMDMQV